MLSSEKDPRDKELDYYKRQLDKLTGDHLRNQYVISKLTTATKEYTKGFYILAEVQRSFSFLKPQPVFHDQVLDAILSHMSVDSLYLLKYDPVQKRLISYLSKGNAQKEALSTLTLSLPDWFYTERRTLFASVGTSMTLTEVYIKEQLQLPYFILTPLFVNDVCWGVLYAGRKHQVRPMFQPFSPSDIDVFEAIGGMIASLTHQLAQHDAVERERNRIAQEMHDDIGSGLTHIALLSELMQSNKRVDEETLKEFARIATSARSLTDSVGEIIWALNPQYGTLNDLLMYLREQTTTLFEPFDLQYEIVFPKEVPSLPLNNLQRRNLYLVIKEALNNALKHASASQIKLRLDIQPHEICFGVTDNGVGIGAAKKRSTSNGLRNLHKRMSDLGGGCIIETGHAGTSIRFCLPLNSGDTTFFTPVNH